MQTPRCSNSLTHFRQIHAREWISGATVQYVAHQLIVRYGKDGQEDVTQLLKRLEFVIVPCMNPDGCTYFLIDHLNVI